MLLSLAKWYLLPVYAICGIGVSRVVDLELESFQNWSADQKWCGALHDEALDSPNYAVDEGWHVHRPG